MDNVFLFAPNLIGYVRIITLIISLYYMPTTPDYAAFYYLLSNFLDAFDGMAARKFNQCYVRIITLIISLYYMLTTPYYAAFYYLLSSFLDEFDGMAARKFNQCSGFGAVLDMVTDRCATLCLMVVLSYFYPNFMLCFQLLIMLDIFSHWFQMYSSLMRGETSHKFIDLSANPIMKFYYERPVLFIMCAGNELFFSSLYLLYFHNGPVIPIFGFGAWWVLLFFTTPIFVLKQIVSVVQLVVASQNIASMDMTLRANNKANS